MKQNNPAAYCLIAISSLLFSFCANALTIEKMLARSQTDGKYIQPSPREFEEAYALFLELFKGNWSKKIQKKWHEMGFEFCTTCQSRNDSAILREKTNEKKGRGFYLFSKSVVQPKILEMPHSMKDLDTGTIGLKLALENTFTAVGFNTTPRSYTDQVRKTRESADLSDLYGTIFEAFTKAFASTYKNGRIIQLHGFAKEKRKTATAMASHLIISNGTREPDVAFTSLDQCFEDKLFLISGIYPTEVTELGATRTSIGIILRNMGHPGFVHIEMNRSFRLRMLKEKETRKYFIECINESLQ